LPPEYLKSTLLTIRANWLCFIFNSSASHPGELTNHPRPNNFAKSLSTQRAPKEGPSKPS
jgi:hypothetical protein